MHPASLYLSGQVASWRCAAEQVMTLRWRRPARVDTIYLFYAQSGGVRRPSTSRRAPAAASSQYRHRSGVRQAGRDKSRCYWYVNEIFIEHLDVGWVVPDARAQGYDERLRAPLSAPACRSLSGKPRLQDGRRSGAHHAKAGTPMAAIVRFGTRVVPEKDQIIRECREQKQPVHGPHVEAFEAEFAQSLAAATCARCRPEHFCRMGLYFILKSLDFPPGSEIIVPALTFWVVPEICRVAGLKLVFADIDPLDVHAADPKAVERAITPNTRAILPTHLYGMAVRHGPDHGHREATQPQSDRGLCAFAWRHIGADGW
ncbi:MAG: DegT/DnrJ/EryC1/StrS family aminotransferase [Vicinamibacterales bacterium]